MSSAVFTSTASETKCLEICFATPVLLVLVTPCLLKPSNNRVNHFVIAARVETFMKYVKSYMPSTFDTSDKAHTGADQIKQLIRVMGSSH